MKRSFGFLLLFLSYLLMALVANKVHSEVNMFGVVVAIPMALLFFIALGMFYSWPWKKILAGGFASLVLSVVLAWISYTNNIIWPMVVFGIFPAWVVFGAVISNGFKDLPGTRFSSVDLDMIRNDLPENQK